MSTFPAIYPTRSSPPHKPRVRHRRDDKMRRNGPPDFSSLSYWSDRFLSETEFEWLARSEVIVPVVQSSAEVVFSVRTAASVPRDSASIIDISADIQTGDSAPHPFNMLHFGCGSSSLGSDIQAHLRLPGATVKVTDTDYVLPSLLSDRSVDLVQVDMLDPSSLGSIIPTSGQWDMVVDKSTADAISCGPSITIDGMTRQPLDVLCANLAAVTRPGGRWICISYSATRFVFLDAAAEASDTIDATPRPRWKLVSRQPLTTSSMSEGRVVPDGKGFRTVYEPETPIWLYILERV